MISHENVRLYLNLKRPFFQTWYDDRDNWALDFDFNFLPLSIVQGHSCLRNQKLPQIQASIWLKFSVLPRVVGLLKLIPYIDKSADQWMDE